MCLELIEFSNTPNFEKFVPLFDGNEYSVNGILRTRTARENMEFDF